VVLAIGLSLLDITVKQLSLSATARDSEIAFYAANAAVECGQAERQTIDVFSAIPNNLTFNCFSTSFPAAYSRTGNVHRYAASSTWANADGVNLCSEIELFIVDSRSGTTTYPTSFTRNGLSKTSCTLGNICTVIFSRGFNRACNQLNSLRVVQRELTVDF
jgi:Tfp pilus assembly protein PilX